MKPQEFHHIYSPYQNNHEGVQSVVRKSDNDVEWDDALACLLFHLTHHDCTVIYDFGKWKNILQIGPNLCLYGRYFKEMDQWP